MSEVLAYIFGGLTPPVAFLAFWQVKKRFFTQEEQKEDEEEEEKEEEGSDWLDDLQEEEEEEESIWEPDNARRYHPFRANFSPEEIESLEEVEEEEDAKPKYLTADQARQIHKENKRQMQMNAERIVHALWEKHVKDEIQETIDKGETCTYIHKRNGMTEPELLALRQKAIELGYKVETEEKTKEYNFFDIGWS